MAVLGAAGSAPVAAADLVVLESGAPTYPAGKMIGAATPIKLAAGEFVVVVTEDARLVRIVGPHDGPAIGTSPDESAVRKAIDRLVSADQPRVGGVGAVRGSEESAIDADTRPGPWLLHAEIDGEQCALRDRSIELWRRRRPPAPPRRSPRPRTTRSSRFAGSKALRARRGRPTFARDR